MLYDWFHLLFEDINACGVAMEAKKPHLGD
jgi:hypothetical protein